MINRTVFFAAVRASLFGGKLTQPQVDGMGAILDAAQTHGVTLAQEAYFFATVFHETGRKMQPVEENLNYTSASRIRAVWPSRFASESTAAPYVKQPEKLANYVYGGRLGNDLPGDGWKYRGRGMPQLTGKVNYKKASDTTKIDLVSNPDAALQLIPSVEIMYDAMLRGWFTGKSIGDYISATAQDFVNARRVVNGTDSAAKIAGYAEAFLSAFQQAQAPLPAAPEPVPVIPPPPDVPAPAPAPRPVTPVPSSGGFWTWLGDLLAAIFGAKK